MEGLEEAGPPIPRPILWGLIIRSRPGWALYLPPAISRAAPPLPEYVVLITGTRYGRPDAAPEVICG